MKLGRRHSLARLAGSESGVKQQQNLTPLSVSSSDFVTAVDALSGKTAIFSCAFKLAHPYDVHRFVAGVF